MVGLSELAAVGLLQGLVLAVVACGVMITFKLLSLPDLTAEGSYPLGAIICAVLLSAGFNPLGATVAGAIGAGILGVCTALIYLRLGIDTLLGGIVLSSMVYSVNLHLMGRPNIPLFDTITVFIGSGIAGKIFLILGVVTALALLIFFFLSSELGLCFRAVGLNRSFAARQGINTERYIVAGFFCSNLLCGLGGAIMVQLQRYADIGMGVGMVIHALAALLVGESILRLRNTIVIQLAAPIMILLHLS